MHAFQEERDLMEEVSCLRNEGLEKSGVLIQTADSNILQAASQTFAAMRTVATTSPSWSWRLDSESESSSPEH